jgi:hypothetical protein
MVVYINSLIRLHGQLYLYLLHKQIGNWCQLNSRHQYCGVFTPCKNCNLETRSRDYATVDEEVFSPCRSVPRRALPCHAESRLNPPSPRIATPLSLPDNSYKHLDDAIVGMGHMIACSAVTQQ